MRAQRMFQRATKRPCFNPGVLLATDFGKSWLDRSLLHDLLSNSDVDIISYHYYGSGDGARVKKDCELARKHNKVYV